MPKPLADGTKGEPCLGSATTCSLLRGREQPDLFPDTTREVGMPGFEPGRLWELRGFHPVVRRGGEVESRMLLDWKSSARTNERHPREVVVPEGLEPPTPRM